MKYIKTFEKYSGNLTFEGLVATMPEDIQEIYEKLKTVEQRKDAHPEGVVYNHVKIVTERAIKYGDFDLIITALFHDLGKLSTTRFDKGYPTSYGHEAESTKILEQHKDWVEKQGANYEAVHFVVSNHMKAHRMGEMRPAKQEILKSSPYFDRLVKFSYMDSMLIPYEG